MKTESKGREGIAQNSQNYVPLRATIHRYGFRYTLLSKSDSAFIYAQWGYNQIIGYEVFRRRTREGRVLNGKYLPACERFPNHEAFGYWAWSFWTKEKAIRKFKEISNEPMKKGTNIISSPLGSKSSTGKS